MSIHIITGRTGTPHITSQQQRDIYAAIVGVEDYVANVGHCFEAEIMDNNTVRIADGVAIFNGCAASIDANDYEDVTIASGISGQNRKDLICLVYRRGSQDGEIVESVGLEVLEGESTSGDASVTYLSSSRPTIRDGADLYYFPIYEVSLENRVITEVEPIFKKIKALTDEEATSGDVQFFEEWIELDSNYFINLQQATATKFANYRDTPETNLQYKVCGNTVQITGYITPTETITGSTDEETIGVIPPSIAPKQNVRIVCQGAGECTWLLGIYPTGRITFSRYRNGSGFTDCAAGRWLTLHSTFLI